MSIKLTKKAANYIKNCLKKRGKGIGLRISINVSGCSGLSYRLEYVDNLRFDDVVFEYNKIKIVIEKKKLFYVNGMELDFIKNELTEGLKFNNPNAKNKCSCGKSFNI